MPRLLLAAVVLAILAQRASARTRAAPSPIASPGGRIDDDYDEDDGFDLDEDAFLFADEEETFDAAAAAREEPEQVDVSGGGRVGDALPAESFWRAVADALGLDMFGNPRRATDASAGGKTSRARAGRARTSSAGPNAFCLNVSEPRYYAAPAQCACDCAGCNCRRYYACWDCEANGGCLSQATYLCAEGDFSYFNEELQACAWEQPRPLPYGCPPRPPGPPKPPKPPRPPAGPPRPERPPPLPGFPSQPPRPVGPTFTPQPVGQFPGGQFPGGQFPGQFPGQQPGQFPGQFPGQQPGQFPGQQPGQFPGQQPGQFQPGVGQQPQNPGQQTQAGSCSSIPQCNSCLQTSDQSAFVCCCDLECTSWSPNLPNQPPGFLGCCNDYNQVCARQQGRRLRL